MPDLAGEWYFYDDPENDINGLWKDDEQEDIRLDDVRNRFSTKRKKEKFIISDRIQYIIDEEQSQEEERAIMFTSILDEKIENIEDIELQLVLKDMFKLIIGYRFQSKKNISNEIFEFTVEKILKMEEKDLSKLLEKIKSDKWLNSVEKLNWDDENFYLLLHISSALLGRILEIIQKEHWGKWSLNAGLYGYHPEELVETYLDLISDNEVRKTVSPIFTWEVEQIKNITYQELVKVQKFLMHFWEENTKQLIIELISKENVKWWKLYETFNSVYYDDGDRQLGYIETAIALIEEIQRIMREEKSKRYWKAEDRGDMYWDEDDTYYWDAD